MHSELIAEEIKTQDVMRAEKSWQIILKEDKAALDSKINHLTGFIDSKEFSVLNRGDKTLIRAQKEAMINYSNILITRINNFK